MATSPIYSWPEPDNTDLVKNGALAIRTLGNAIDTTMATMVPKTIIDAKGDIIAGTAADTASRLAVGANDTVLTADSSTATGLKWAAAAAGGGLTLLQSLTLSGASVTSSTFTATSYKNYFVVLSDIYLANPNSDFDLRLNGDSGSNYNRSGVLCAAGSLSGGVTSNGSSFRLGTLGALSGAGQRGYGTIQINRINDTSEVYISSQLYSTLSAGSDIRFMQSGGIYNNSAAITSLTFLAATNDFAAGTAYIYGVN